MARAPVNTDIGRPDLAQTVARPSGISAPVATVQETPGMALAQSLVSLRPELSDHIATVQGWHQEDEANRAYDTIQGMTYEEARAAVSNGTMRETESPWFRAAFQKQFGLAHAADRRRQIITAYNNEFDKDNGNLDEFLTGFVQEDLQAYDGSDFILAGIREGMGNTLSAIRDQHAEYRSSQLQARAVDQFYSVAGGAVDQTVEQGGDVGAALSAIYKDHESALGLTPDQMDEQALALAERYASEGNVAAVEAILNADPSGRGSFASRSSFAIPSQELIAEARKNKGSQLRVENTGTRVSLEDRAKRGALTEEDLGVIEGMRATGQMTQDQVEGILTQNNSAQNTRLADVFKLNTETEAKNQATDLLLQGKAGLLTDQEIINPHTGEVVKIDAEEITDAVVNEQIEGMLAKDATPQVVAAQLASWGVATTYTPWENLMTNGANAISTQLATVGPDGMTKLPEPAITGYALFRALEGQRSVRDHHIKDATVAALYRDAELLEKHGALSPEEALLAASRIDRKSGRTNLSTAIERDKFNTAAGKVTKGGWWDDNAENAGDAVMALEGLTRIYMDLGVPMDAAIKDAAEDVEASYVNLGGILVNVRDKFIPPDFAEISQIAVEDYAATQGRDADEFRLWPVDGQDLWIIQEVGTMRPALGSRPIHISKLQKNPRAYSMADANKEVRENR